MRAVHAFADDALGDADAVGLVDRLAAGDVSAAELVEAAIARTEAVNPALNGLAYSAFDSARTRAAVRYGGLFDGVPTFVKDNINVAGMPTMAGTDAWQPQRAGGDSEFAKLYLSTGLIALGKTQLSEFGFSASAEHPRLGAVRNPWDTDYTAGASSSGSAALVAAGAVPIAHANDGGGSIRIPASCTGLVGLKPSRGRLPLDKAMRWMPVNIVCNGVLTRTVRDTAVFYREAERTWANGRLPPIGDVAGPGKRRLKIAVITRSLRADSSPEVRDLTLAVAGLLDELGHRVEPVDALPVPRGLADDFLLYWAFLGSIAVRNGSRMFGASFDPGRLDNLTLGLADYARHHRRRLPAAIARLRASRRHTARLFRDYDVVLTPTVGHQTPRIGYLDPTAQYGQIIDRLMSWAIFTPVQNATGEPAISLPLARTGAGLPQGMMFTAPLGVEARLLALAYELEEARPFERIQAVAAA